MLADICDLKSLFRVCIKNRLDQVSGITGDEFRNAVFTIKDLLVKVGGVRVLKGQVTANHSKEDHTTAPNIHIGSEVTLPSYHLRGSVAWRTTSCFQSLSGLIGIRKPEINNFDVFLVIQK